MDMDADFGLERRELSIIKRPPALRGSSAFSITTSGMDCDGGEFMGGMRILLRRSAFTHHAAAG